jgi:DNA-binding winged helix-turn-helix (wHTH) protein
MRSATRSTGEIELDLGRYELRRAGRRVKLEKKPMELLIFLVARREQLVSREDIVKKLWRSELFIDTERNVNNIVRKVRTALADNADRPRYLETVVGKGYRFIGPVRVISGQLLNYDLAQEPALAPQHALMRGEQPSLAILPFVLLGNATDDHGLCLGVADALVSQLGNMQGIVVLPTALMIDLPPAPPSDIASRLGVRFVVHGAIQFSKGQWRLALEMFDASTQRACFSRKCDLDVTRLPELERNLAKDIASTLKRPLEIAVAQRPRYSRDPMAYAEFMQGYRLGSSGDRSLLERASQHLSNAVTRDPAFALAHASLSLLFATRHFEFDPASVWLEKAEFHCGRALELNPDLAEAHVARAFLLWGPAKNFQHLEAIAELKRALALQKNLPHAYNRLGTILAHVGLLEHAREMYQRARQFHPKHEVSPSIVQVYMWSCQYDPAREYIDAWRAENPTNKYALYFALQHAMMTGHWDEAEILLHEALQVVPDEPLIISLQGVFFALTAKTDAALNCLAKACASPKSFGHAHHTYYQIACILALTGQGETSFQWLERSVSTGFACWPYFLKDPCLESLRGLPDFEFLIGALQAKYPDHLGLL